jgi:hypothetical protein
VSRKKRKPERAADYRLLTLLNADFKLLTRLIANRLRPWIQDILHPHQYCGSLQNNIFGVIPAIRETIAKAEMTRAPVCIMSLDFKEAFDKIAHRYLFEVLESSRSSREFQLRIKRTYSDATSSIQVNGHVSSPLPIKSSIRQGCPLSNAPTYIVF